MKVWLGNYVRSAALTYGLCLVAGLAWALPLAASDGEKAKELLLYRGIIPDPEKLSDAELKELAGMPGFKKLMDMVEAGTKPYPEDVKEVMWEAGAQGYELRNLDSKDPSKGKIWVDVATGQVVSESKAK